MGKCCVPGCRNSRERIPGLTFHQIPSSEPSRTQWMDVLAKNGVKVFTEWTLVCGDHFTHEDYKMTARKNFLLPSAVPSVFTIKPCKNAPRKRGRKPKALLQQQQQQAAQVTSAPQRVTVLRSVVAEDAELGEDDVDDAEDDASGGVRRTGRHRKQKVFTDMVVYMPKAASESDLKLDEGEAEETVTLTFPRQEDDDGDCPEEDGDASQDAASSVENQEAEATRLEEQAPSDAQQSSISQGDDAGTKSPPKNLNVIVFTNQPRPGSGSARGRAADYGAEVAETGLAVRPKRRCCQIQTQRLLFYKSVIVKLRKRVLALEASLAEKERELAAIEAEKDVDMV
uniref:THAP-type domain-containing protein n=1 Tax=Amblyomma aureolatum TaxID=187763 RepID=A0A1E1XD44_9ACAR